MVPFTDYYDDEDAVVVVKSGKILYCMLRSICQPFTQAPLLFRSTFFSYLTGAVERQRGLLRFCTALDWYRVYSSTAVVVVLVVALCSSVRMILWKRVIVIPLDNGSIFFIVESSFIRCGFNYFGVDFRKCEFFLNANF